MRKSIFLLAVIFLFKTAHSQEIDEPCGQVNYLQALENKFPGIIEANQTYYEDALKYSSNSKLNKIGSEDTIFRIPVVFHVVYNTTDENVNDSFIYSQIKVLNACFRRQNSDTVNTRDIFKPFSTDARIEFYLAETDPSGNATNGITRTFTNIQEFYDFNFSDKMKFNSTGGHDAWDPSKYLNIWVCDLSYNNLDALLGYSFPPTNAAFWQSNMFVPVARQGVVLHYKIIGENNPLLAIPESTGEKTCVHEVGHYLGLRHVWGDGNSSNGCNLDDGIFDTPNTRLKHSGCNKNLNTCGAGSAGDFPDQAENYMDYSSKLCTNMFTKEQVGLMRYNLEYLRSTVPERTILKPEVVLYVNALYPNPSQGKLTLELSQVNYDEIYKIVFKDMVGQTAWVMKDKLTNRTELSVLGLESGLYFIEIYNQSGKKLYGQKLLFMGK